jgi:hypothetical protein
MSASMPRRALKTAGESVRKSYLLISPMASPVPIAIVLESIAD